MVAVLAASTAFLAGVAAATASLFQYGIAQAEARRADLLRLEGLTSVRTWYSRTAGSATELRGAIDAVADSAAISRARVSGYGEQLYRAGLRGQTLRDALEGVAIVSAVQGDEMANRFRGMAVAAARTGGSVEALTRRVRSRLGGTAQAMALGWGRQMERLRESWARLFDGLEIDGALRQFQRFVNLFSQSTASGRALRQLFEVLFQPILDGIERAGPALISFFEGGLIAVQELTIAFLRARNWIRRTFGIETLGGLQGFVDMTELGRLAVFGFVSAIQTSLVVLGVAGAALAAVTAVWWIPVVALGAIAFGFFQIGLAIRNFVSNARTYLSTVDWSGIGRDLIAGLARGLSIDGPAMGAIQSLASRLTETLRASLDIRSPSRVFAALGRQIPRGLAVGVEADARISTSAIEGLGAVPEGGAVGGGRGGGNVHVSIDGIQVVVGSAAEVPSSLAENIRQAVAEALAGFAVEMGAARG